MLILSIILESIQSGFRLDSMSPKTNAQNDTIVRPASQISIFLFLLIVRKLSNYRSKTMTLFGPNFSEFFSGPPPKVFGALGLFLNWSNRKLGKPSSIVNSFYFPDTPSDLKCQKIHRYSTILSEIIIQLSDDRCTNSG